MSCCGKHRQQFFAPARANPVSAAATDRQSFRTSVAFFEYVGNTSMVVAGPVSGKRYHFEQPGARVAVDPVDKPSLAAVPHLRQVYSG